jgi:glycosyltransferase involved in cell wall biosynthesis
VSALLTDDYLHRLYTRQPVAAGDILRSYWRRHEVLRTVDQYDLLWIEYEALPWVPYPLERYLRGSGTGYVVDYDDAVFHRYDLHRLPPVRWALGSKIDRVMRDATVVIAGNSYISMRAEKAGARRIEIVPTVIDLARYPREPLPAREGFTIGWIGSPSTSHYLATIREALKAVCAGGGARVVVIGDPGYALEGVPLEVVPWDDATETREMRRFDVGIMPLSDSPWERGKCGHKLIHYMGCCRAVVASPVGVNRTIVENGVNGFLASDVPEWIEVLSRLRDDFALRRRMGMAGRAKVETTYSLQVTAPKLVSILEEARGMEK